MASTRSASVTIKQSSSRLGKMVIGGAPPKLDFTARAVGMVVVDVALAANDMLIKHGVIPADFMK